MKPDDPVVTLKERLDEKLIHLNRIYNKKDN